MIGGEIVPAVMLVAVIVVSVGSMSVAELYSGLCRVAVVMVVCRLLWMRRFVNGCWGRSLKRLMLKSPVRVISVLGFLERMELMAVWKFVAMVWLFSGFCVLFGRLYRLIIVCIGVVFCSFLCIWMVQDAMSVILMGRTVTCRLGL